jgi:hypothetical protein
MKDFFSPAIIAAVTSLIISLLTLYQFLKNKHFLELQAAKASDRAFTSKLYDLRLEHYPKAFELLDNIYKEKGGVLNPQIVAETCKALTSWKKGIVGLIISNEANQSFHELRDAMIKNPSSVDKFSTEQIEKIMVATKEFRRQLRRDIGFIFREEKNRRKQELINN